MDNGLWSLSDLFTNRLFRIPDYQRGYAWKHEQLVDFWEDLVNLREGRARYHYTGMLSLKEIDPQEVKFGDDDDWRWLLEEEGYKPYHIVDGQQRLTTISIVLNGIVAFVKGLPENNRRDDRDILFGNKSLKEIKDKYILVIRQPENITKTYLFGYETDNPSAKYMRYKIFDEPFGDTVDETYYTKNLKYAKDFFAKELDAVYRKEKDGIKCILRLYQKVTHKLMFNLYEIQYDYNEFVAFETMNNRGKKLTNLELLKNRLIYLTTLFDDTQFDKIDKDSLRKNINKAWKEVYYQLGRHQVNEPLGEDEFLRAHWIVYFGYSTKKDAVMRFLLNKFSAKDVLKEHAVTQGVKDTPAPSDYEQDEAGNEVETQTEPQIMSESKHAPMSIEINDYVNSLKSFAEYWYYSFYPFKSGFDAEEQEKVWIDRLNRIRLGYYFRPLVTAAMSKRKETTPNDRISLFQAIERFVFVTFGLGKSQANFQSSFYYKKAREVFNGTVTLNSVTAGLNKRVDDSMVSVMNTFVSSIDGLFKKGDGFYGWGSLKYFLYEYECELAEKRIKKVDWDDFTHSEKDKVTIEHILPQTLTDWWRDRFSAYTDEQIKFFSASLGNLLPLSQAINASLQNHSFPEKKTPSTKGRRGYSDGSHSEIEVAKNNDWTAAEIFERGMKLLEFMKDRWGLTFKEGTWSNLLHIKQAGGKFEILETIDEKELRRRYLDFWTKFFDYCKDRGREDIGDKKPAGDGWYNIDIGRPDYFLCFWFDEDKGILGLSIGIPKKYMEAFKRLESKKSEIEAEYGSPLEWSENKNDESWINHSIEVADVLDPALYEQHFKWMVEHYVKLRNALETVDGKR